ncbi:carboxypeptidase-like regulatory domain-containing protein [Myroides odoratus]|uniref:TonB-dependent receptor n=1 Tax=Myroides odoratus TaxID=256 RepID=UPI0039AFFA4A
MIKRLGITVWMFMMCIGSYAQSKAIVQGKVIEKQSRKEISKVQVLLQNGTAKTITNTKGEFTLEVPADEPIHIRIVGYVCDMNQKIKLKSNEIHKIIFVCEENTEIHPYLVADEFRGDTLQSKLMPTVEILNYRGAFDRDLSSVSLTGITDAVGNTNRLETILTTLPGVNSNNEMSSQFNVRGGSFDENLIYVNGIEMYRPFLIRSGKQEGLSFINPTLVQDINFSAGGFKARYGDKLSSVLAITYRKPTENKAYLQASFLGAGATVDLVSKDQALTAIIGMRYHNNRLLMNRKDDDGYYKPSFMDAQTVVNYKFNDQWDFSFIGNITGNQYKYEPNRADVAFGGYNNVSNVTILYDGKEEDKYSSLFGAIVSTYEKRRTKIEGIVSAYHTQEKEYYDIEASYLVMDSQESDSDPLFGNDIENPLPSRKGIASQYTHARNNYDALSVSAEVKGTHYLEDGNTSLRWGLKYVRENIKDRLLEWELMDSLGYILPNKQEYSALHTKHTVDINRFMGYGEWNKVIDINTLVLTLNAGARMQAWKMPKGGSTQFVVSPRAQVALEPSAWEKDMLFSFAFGLYQQPPSYREYRGLDGELNPDLKAQKAYVFVLGHNYRFKMWDRNFRMQSELYYKDIQNVNVYTLDNVRVRYVANNEAKAYVYGADVRLYGEFIAGTESWVSVGFMKTEENYQGKGYIARPTDQRLKFGLLFQDYVPSIPNLRLYLNAVYNTGLPGGSPSYVDPYLYQGRLRDYKRADIGFNYVFKDDTVGQSSNWLQGIDHLQIGIEVYNVFNIANAITNTWIRDLSTNNEYAIPNFMTNRTFNLKVALAF